MAGKSGIGMNTGSVIYTISKKSLSDTRIEKLKKKKELKKQGKLK